ncbi:uncharacterized protein LOC116928966 [Daphnia magna]|uniref:Coiled-coil domain-containing protein 167 n=1 Tax=Daphnia magna TaxID=35525 RepID=A0A164VZX6_9CRUS|nr:uncharacterized protein LOC116928966 [Daphnia magna]KZS12819.1 Coiled-coil domain-containing protein 167 [Daphnia magna]
MGSKSVTTEIEKREREVKQFYHRIETVEKALRLRELTPDQRTEFEKELDLLKTVLKNNEEQLKSLQKENYKTGIIAMALIFICFLVYGLQVMFWNKSSH